MTLLLKDPEAVLDYAIDWGAQYLDAGDLLADSSWSVDPDEPGGVAVAGSSFGDSISTVQAAGGLPGRLYRIAGGWRYVDPIDGMSAYVKATSTWANYRAGSWEVGTLRGAGLVIGGTQVVGSRLAAIAGPSGGSIVDPESRAAIDQILAALRQHGLIES